MSSGPRAKCDQVVFEAICKAAEIIVAARSVLHPTNNTTARFNLQVPEIPQLRHALQHHKQSLHLPLRLEIYCNTQLVERWSLEYSTTSNGSVLLQGGDSIAQLRHVCKKVVLWLRILYCYTRILPSHALRGSLSYRLEVSDTETMLPFEYTASPSVPTPFGILQYRVWYAPQVQKPTSQPIPIVSTPISQNAAHQAKSAPTQQLLQPARSYSSRSIHRAHSNVEDHFDHQEPKSHDSRRHHRSQSLHSRRALHEPATYAYNQSHTNLVSLQAPPTLSSSPSSTPIPATPPLSSTPPTLKLPGVMMTEAPPFTGLPRELSSEEPLHFDLLQSSPFVKSSTAFNSVLLQAPEESWLLRSSVAAAADDEEDDMPFAVDDEGDIQASFTRVAQRLSFLESPSQEDDLQQLTRQLQEFKTFGATLAQD